MNNLRHVLDADCTDPDCEIHNIAVGITEGTVSETNIAFYLAGAFAMEMGIRGAFTYGTDMREAVIQAALQTSRPMLNAVGEFLERE